MSNKLILNKIKASVIIPTKDKASRLKLTLKALESQLSHSIEVILVMDGCSSYVINEINRYIESKLAFSPKIIISNKNIGRAAARNKGIRNSEGKIIIFLDDDRIPGPNFLKQHIKWHSQKCVVIGGRKDVIISEEELSKFSRSNAMFNKYKKKLLHARNEKLILFRKLSRLISHKLIDSISFMTGNASVEKEDIEQAGMFDENFTGWGYEDVDLGYRLANSGIKFIRDYSILNFHLNHDPSRKNQKSESRKSLNYFLKKIKKDKAAQFLTLLYYYFYFYFFRN